MNACCKCKLFGITVHCIFVKDCLRDSGLCACVHHVLVLPPQGPTGVCPKTWEREREVGGTTTTTEDATI